MNPDPSPALDIDALWEYGDPVASEARFRAALPTADADGRRELQTQIARSYGLQGRYDDGHALLDEVAADLAGAGPRPRICLQLERGRLFNSAGDPQQARGHFVTAWKTARDAAETGLAVDAAHMLAITHGGTANAVEWNRRGLELARPSDDRQAQALIPALLNNAAWDLHEMGRCDAALPLFEEALAAWTARERPRQVQIARWAVARCLRSLNRHEEALVILRDLEAEHTAAGNVDGYVFEELAENLAAQKDVVAARPYFRRAHDALREDQWLVANEPERLAALASKGGVK